jgi:hypothetical protein
MEARRPVIIIYFPKHFSMEFQVEGNAPASKGTSISYGMEISEEHLKE